MQTPLPDDYFNQIIVELSKKSSLPLKASDLLARYSEAVFKVRQELPNSDHDATYDLVLKMNYEAVSQKTRNLRLDLLQIWRDRIIEQITIENCLPTLTVEFLSNEVTKEFIDNLPGIFDFAVTFKDENHRISKCFDDLQMLFLKITEQIMCFYELKDQFNTEIGQEIGSIRKDLNRFCEEYFYYFHVGLQRHIKEVVKKNPFEVPKIPQMQRIKSSFNKYQDKVTHEVGVSRWLLPDNLLKEQLANQQLNIKNEISKTFHNKSEFELKTKVKLYQLLQKNDKKANFEFLNPSQKPELMNILCTVVHELPTILEARQDLRAKLLGLSVMGIQYDFNRLFQFDADKPVQVKWTPENEELNLLTMINLFLLFVENYNCTSRQFLRTIFRYLKNFEYGYSNFKVLLALENVDMELIEFMGNNPTVSKTFESEAIDTEESKTNLSKLSENTAVTETKEASKEVLQVKQKSLLELLRTEDKAFTRKQIQVLMTKINIHKLNKFFKKLPLIDFQKISNPKTRSRVITICVSGFISQDDVKDQSWRQLIKEHEGEVYALNWQSKTTKDMVMYTWKRIETLVVNKIFYSVPILNIMTIVTALIDAYKANPFYAAFDEAVLAGKMLGNLLPKIFPNCLINLVGFSLGTELIKECIKVMKKSGTQGMLNKAILIGGVADRSDLKQVLANAPFQTYNFYGKNDQILKILFKICKPMSQPCGLAPIEGPLVENIDCTEFVDGHGRYRAEFEQIYRRIQLDDDTHYYYQ